MPPGAGYRVRRVSDGAQSAALTVHSESAAPWNPAIYNQSIPSNGYTYLTTRDGTKLAHQRAPADEPGGRARPPAGHAASERPRRTLPPYPTLIEYSGYGYANPAGPDERHRGAREPDGLRGRRREHARHRLLGRRVRLLRAAAEPRRLRRDRDDRPPAVGAGPQGRDDGHLLRRDQPAVHGAAPARRRLAAISPLSVLDATATTLYPGGILNTGFAVAWAKERQHEALPAGPNSGQPWAYQQIQSGDTTCAANQVLHGEAADLSAKIAANSHYDAAVADPLDPVTFVNKIKVPVFMACQWEDEQTGGHCPELVRHFTGTTQKWFTFTNGAHIDSLDPDTYNRWYDFLQLFVAHQAPIENVGDHPRRRAGHLPGGDGPPADRRRHAAGRPHPADPDVRPRPSPRSSSSRRCGCCSTTAPAQSPTRNREPGRPVSRVRAGLLVAPGPGHHRAHLVLRAGRRARRHAADERRRSTRSPSNAHALPLTDYGTNTGTGGLWGNASQWQWNWQQNPAGTAVSYVSAPLTANTTVIGSGAVDLWVRSSTPDVDLQATISEVRPDGNETFVQNGWIRASERKLSTDSNNMFKRPSTALEPIPTLHGGRRVADAGRAVRQGRRPALLPGPRVPRRVAHPGDDRRAERHATDLVVRPDGAEPGGDVSIAFSTSMPSSLVLPVVPGVSVPTALPPCPSLRNEPCRPYQAIVNTTAVP